MMWLSMGSLHVLHERFTENDGELDVQQFCEIMMELCVMREEEDAVHKCRRLIDLFVQIDVNGDGSMEWDELSAFIIESGMAASSKAKIGLRLTYDAITSLVHNCRRKEAHAAPRGSTTATCVMAAAAALLGAAGGAAPDALDPAAADSDAAPKKPNENVLRWHGGRATSINLVL